MFYVCYAHGKGERGCIVSLLGKGAGKRGFGEGGWFLRDVRIPKGSGFVMAAFFLVWFGLDAGGEIGLWLWLLGWHAGFVATRAK